MWQHTREPNTLIHDGSSQKASTLIGWVCPGAPDQGRSKVKWIQCPSYRRNCVSAGRLLNSPSCRHIPAASITQGPEGAHAIPDRWFRPRTGKFNQS